MAGPIPMNMPCGECRGSGVLEGPPCPVCGGSGEVTAPVRLRVKIPAGVEEGSRIRLAGQGGPGVAGGPPGDLLLQIRLKDRANVRRDGLDLYVDLPLTVGEALEGAEVDVPVFGGRVRLRVPAGIQSGGKLRLRGKGMPSLRGGHGDLFFVAKVMLPRPDGEDVREAARVLEKHYAGQVREGFVL